MTSASSWKPHYSRFLAGHQGALHLCAHSHHFWLDRTRDAQLKAWDDAARMSDEKWGHVLGDLLTDVQQGVAKRLGISEAGRLTFASNTHELFVRLLSCFEKEGNPIRILSTDSEFHSFRRQVSRLGESREVEVSVIPQFPRETFAERFSTAAKSHRFDIVFLSHVFFNSGGVLPECEKLLHDVKNSCEMLVLDVYHSFLARPFSLAGLEQDIYVLGGGYKYLQAGEGCCYLYTPTKADRLRPKNTGWYAHFASLGSKSVEEVEYSEGALRFWGASFDPTALYRLQAVLAFLDEHQLTSKQVHAHSIGLQEQCLSVLLKMRADAQWKKLLQSAASRVLPSEDRGNFLSFSLGAGEAQMLQCEMKTLGILCDSRESQAQSFLRLGFGLYHNAEDLESLRKRLGA